MKLSCFYKSFTAICIFASVGGCRTYVPAMQEVWDNQGDKSKNIPPPLESDIKHRVFCDIKAAVFNQYRHEYQKQFAADVASSIAANKNPDALTLLDLGIQTSLTLQVDETSTISPGVTLNTPMVPSTTYFPNKVTVVTPQSYAFGLGGNLSAHSTRIDKYNFYTTVENLVDRYLSKDPVVQKTVQKEIDDCNSSKFRDGSSFLLQSDLSIPEWLNTAMQLEKVEPGKPNPPPPPPMLLPGEEALELAPAPAGGAPSGLPPELQKDVLTYEVRFDVISTGNITPSWKLVRVTANPTGNLFTANRERNHDVIITFAPRTASDDFTTPKDKETTAWRRLCGTPPAAQGKPSIVVCYDKGASIPASTTIIKKGDILRYGDSKYIKGIGNGEPSISAQNAQLASQIGLAVANNLRDILLPQ
jgi:hypothetical protein